MVIDIPKVNFEVLKLSSIRKATYYYLNVLRMNYTYLNCYFGMGYSHTDSINASQDISKSCSSSHVLYKNGSSTSKSGYSASNRGGNSASHSNPGNSARGRVFATVDVIDTTESERRNLRRSNRQSNLQQSDRINVYNSFNPNTSSNINTDEQSSVHTDVNTLSKELKTNASDINRKSVDNYVSVPHNDNNNPVEVKGLDKTLRAKRFIHWYM